MAPSDADAVAGTAGGGPDGSATRGASVWPMLGLAIAGDTGLERHFAAEFGPPTPADPEHLPSEVLVLVRPVEGSADASVGQGRYKTTRWQVRLGPPSGRPVSCELRIQGVFGRSLVQSLVVEPLLSIAHAREERALVSAAALEVGGRAVVLVGGSRSGKSSLAMRAWSRGIPLLADDRVIVRPDGTATGVRRRLRVYPDLASTAPGAVRRLSPRTRARLRARGALQRLTAGWIALPELVGSVGIQEAPASLAIDRLVVIERSPRSGRTASGAVAETDAPDRVWARLGEILQSDLDWPAGQGPRWAAEAREAGSRQDRILRQALVQAGSDATLISVPADWPAAVAVAALARHLGLEE